jgi:hypothetical protein
MSAASPPRRHDQLGVPASWALYTGIRRSRLEREHGRGGLCILKNLFRFDQIKKPISLHVDEAE